MSSRKQSRKSRRISGCSNTREHIYLIQECTPTLCFALTQSRDGYDSDLKYFIAEGLSSSKGIQSTKICFKLTPSLSSNHPTVCI